MSAGPKGREGWWGPVPLCSAPCVSPTAASAVVPIPGTFSWPLAARGKPRRGMLRRAVFSDVQRKALEKMFQKQKYISKPDRKKLAAKLGLKDSQVSGAAGGGRVEGVWRAKIPHSAGAAREMQGRRAWKEGEHPKQVTGDQQCQNVTVPDWVSRITARLPLSSLLGSSKDQIIWLLLALVQARAGF